MGGKRGGKKTSHLEGKVRKASPREKSSRELCTDSWDLLPDPEVFSRRRTFTPKTRILVLYKVPVSFETASKTGIHQVFPGLISPTSASLKLPFPTKLLCYFNTTGGGGR